MELWDPFSSISLIIGDQLSTKTVPMASIGVLQSLADHEPDVDAVFREVQSTPMTFEVRKTTKSREIVMS